MKNLTSVCGFVKMWYGQVEQLRLGYVIRITSIDQFLRSNQMQTTQIITGYCVWVCDVAESRSRNSKSFHDINKHKLYSENKKNIRLTGCGSLYMSTLRPTWKGTTNHSWSQNPSIINMHLLQFFRLPLLSIAYAVAEIRCSLIFP